MTDPTDVARLARRRTFALLVTCARADGVIVTQLFTTLGAAERKVDRAKARGLYAAQTLVRIVPVASATADEIELLRGEERPR